MWFQGGKRMSCGSSFTPKELSNYQHKSRQKIRPLADQHQFDLGTSLPPSQGRSKKDITTNSGVVLAYLDETNITISTLRQGGRAGLQVDFPKLLYLALNGRKALVKNLYCSEDSKYSGIGGFSIKICPRSQITGGEKMLDTSLTADAVEDIIKFYEFASYGTVILFTGDADLIPVVKKALKYGWSVEIWSYEDSLSNQFEAAVRCSERVEIHLMDTIYDQVVYPPRWRNISEQDKALNALLPCGQPQSRLCLHNWIESRKVAEGFLESSKKRVGDMPIFIPICPNVKENLAVNKEVEPVPCPSGYHCTDGGRGCKNMHSSQELEFFSRNRDSKTRILYKTKMCCPSGGGKCEFRKNKVYLCPFAHGMRDAHCVSCQEIGDHWGDRCPGMVK